MEKHGDTGSRMLWESLNNRLMSTKGLISGETLQNTADKVIWPDTASQLLALNEHWLDEYTNRGSHWQQECNIGLSAPLTTINPARLLSRAQQPTTTNAEPWIWCLAFRDYSQQGWTTMMPLCPEKSVVSSQRNRHIFLGWLSKEYWPFIVCLVYFHGTLVNKNASNGKWDITSSLVKTYWLFQILYSDLLICWDSLPTGAKER